MTTGRRIDAAARVMSLAGAMLAAGPAMAHDPPRNFNECLLRHLPGTTSDRAADAIERACAEEYPAASPIPPSGSNRSIDRAAPLPQATTAQGTAQGTAAPVLKIHGRHLRDIQIDPRQYRIFPQGVEQIVELLVHNRGKVYRVTALTVEIRGAGLRPDSFSVVTDIPSDSSAVIRIRTPRVALDRARFRVDAARGIQFGG